MLVAECSIIMFHYKTLAPAKMWMRTAQRTDWPNDLSTAKFAKWSMLRLIIMQASRRAKLHVKPSTSCEFVTTGSAVAYYVYIFRDCFYYKWLF